MTDAANENADGDFIPPGTLRISDAALQFARDFCAEVGRSQSGNWVIVSGWASSISLKRAPDAPYEDFGACVVLEAGRRNEVPLDFIARQDGLDFAVAIPRFIWESRPQRLIDFDASQLFKLILR
ncbi:MAG: hypothetical protein K8H87_07205 [Pseudorhodoplanes sp.]|nr:hypothetical protein [Pseudorhodoplanes sp.]